MLFKFAILRVVWSDLTMTLLHKDRNNKKKNKSLQKTTFVVFLTEVAQRNV